MRKHHDANQIFRLLIGREIAAKMIADPALVEAACVAVERMATRPHTGAAVALWRDLLAAPVARIADALSRDDPGGDYVREAMPAFVAVDAATRSLLVAKSRALYAEEAAWA